MEEATRISGARMPRRQRRPRDGQRHGASLLGAPPIRNSLKPIDILSQDQVAAVDEAALTLLQETGIEFMGPAARDLLRRAGAKVDDETGLVRIPRELVAEGLNKWSYIVTPITNPLPPGQSPIPFAVMRHIHYDAPVPGTARFRYTIRDPGLWGPCGNACCSTDGHQ